MLKKKKKKKRKQFSFKSQIIKSQAEIWRKVSDTRQFYLHLVTDICLFEECETIFDIGISAVVSLYMYLTNQF